MLFIHIPGSNWDLPRCDGIRFGTEFDFSLEGKSEIEYPKENFSGEVDLRGLDENMKYKVIDYANNKELGIINGDKPYLRVSFDDYLLLELSPL